MRIGHDLLETSAGLASRERHGGQAAWVTLLVSLAAGCGWQAIPNALGYAAMIALVLERRPAASPRPQTQ